MSNFAAPWAVALQAPLSMDFPRQEYWSGLSFPSLVHFPNTRIKLASVALSDGFFTTELYQVSSQVSFLLLEFFSSYRVSWTKL